MSTSPAADAASATAMSEGSVAVNSASVWDARIRLKALRAVVAWRHRDAVILGVAVVAITGLNMLWLSLEPRPPHWDKARHLTTSLDYYDTFKSTSFTHWARAYYIYPPLVYWV